MDEFTFDASSMDGLHRDLLESSVRVRTEIDKTVGVIAEEVKEVAKAMVSKHSKSIPPTMRVEMIPGAAKISAGGVSPLAVLYESGNKKGGKSRAFNSKRTMDTYTARGLVKHLSFAHPVFGNKEVWVDEKRFPFLRPALAADRKGITKRMEAAWDEALKPLLRGGDHG